MIVALLGCTSPAPEAAPNATASPEVTDSPAMPDSSPAVWELATSTAIDSGATVFDVLVMRTECNSGVTGTVNPPLVDFRAEEIVISFTVSPGTPAAATCQGNDQVEYTVTLDQPVGDRRLVDGARR